MFRPDLMGMFTSLFSEETEQDVAMLWAYASKMAGRKIDKLMTD